MISTKNSPFFTAKLKIAIALITCLCTLPFIGYSTPEIYINQVAYDAKAPKKAVIGTDNPLSKKISFLVINAISSKIVFSGLLSHATKMESWALGKTYYEADFSPLVLPGKYKIKIIIDKKPYQSQTFQVDDIALAKLTLPAILHYYRKQRANTAIELNGDKNAVLFGSNKTVDLRGGWCDASGDVSKYFSHLAYANFMSPQQIPLVTWSMISATEKVPNLLSSLNVKDSIVSEALWGADYIMRSLSADDYFYMTLFSYFNKDPKARRVVGLLANSVTTNDYQCAFREGAGMAIASLARISTWNKNGDFTAKQYLDGAKRAFSHLLVNNTKYADDGKDNIIDDYCALMAATELWIATDSSLYQTEARKRANNLAKRMTLAGYFIADDANRPFWHASDAGLPIIALSRYLDKEKDQNLRSIALTTIKKALDYNLSVTNKVENPFGYARQTFMRQGLVKDGFFIPHENETGWWWQGENARLGSLATAALVGGRLVYPKQGGLGTKDSLASFATQQLSWILGCNPYSMCFMYEFGQKNVPYMASNYGHGSERGGISNGITGKEGNADGMGIDFKTSAEGNEWRWTEQWIPHAAWFLQAIAAMADEKPLNRPRL
ncbi:MAG: glycosyl transferase [Sphingobacteriales bacterium]|nr:glycosyl transferase [Sphingobacteriales bacterium]